jgi:CHAT domain-containing protein/Tfp pilus assembly protein PilF
MDTRAFGTAFFPLNGLFCRVCFYLIVVLPMFAEFSAWAQSANQPSQDTANAQVLELDKAIERELAGNQNHAYQIALAAGQYLNATIEQRGIDLTVSLLAPDGKPLAEFDSEIRTHGQETASQVAETAGNYRLVVKAKQKDAPTGRYEIRVAELRAATEKDRALQEARNLGTESERLWRAGKYDEARPLAERALAIREKEQGSEHPDVAAYINLLANLYRDKGDYAKAEPLFQRALLLREKAFGTEHPYVAVSLNSLAAIFSDKGDYANAERLFRRSLIIREKSLGPEHPDVAVSLNNLAIVYSIKGDYAQAEPLYQRALMIREKVFGTEHPEFARTLNSLAILHYNKGEYDKAEPLFQRALAIREKRNGKEHPDVVAPLNNLAMLYHVKGLYEKAEPFYERAILIAGKSLGPEHPDLAGSLDNLANLYRAKGDYAKAISFSQRALMIKEKALGPEHSNLSPTLNHLAILYYHQGNYALAEPLYQRALTIWEKTLGAEHPHVAACLDNIALLNSDKGDFAKAEPLFQRALAIREKRLGSEHPDVAHTLENFASLYRVKGDYAKAEPLHQRALEIREKGLGQEHHYVAYSLNNLARLYEAIGDVTQATNAQIRACSISEHNLALNLATGSERQKLVYLASFATQTNQTISFHAKSAPDDRQARNLAATLILQRKGRALDAMTDSFAALRQRLSSQDQELFDQWKSVAARLSRLVQTGLQKMTPAEYQRLIRELNEQKEELEAQIARRNLDFSLQIKPVTEQAVRAAIPGDAALVEFAVYHPFNAKYSKLDEQFGAPRYIAYVLRQQGEIQWVELGEAEPIDKAVDDWRQAFGKVNEKTGAPVVTEKEIRRLARALDEKVMRPIRALLGETRQVFISPDGKLNLVPFAALVDENNRYLAQRYSINYLTSGRDLLRLQSARESKSEALVVGNPVYGDPDPKAKMYFRPLSAAAELEGIKQAMPEAMVFDKKDATEAVLKQAHAPRILHIATHGFFLPNGGSSSANTRSFSLLGSPAIRSGVDSEAIVENIENPLLLSGLALAGANRLQSGEEDGILTALEVAGLDLWGTKLVVLSACDTGVGEVKNGEGVYGLRRALFLAGAESQMVSLWKVNDSATKDLMVAYYKELLKGIGRAEALRKVQKKMLLDPKRRHPYYWASFIHSGEWANLDGRR